MLPGFDARMFPERADLFRRYADAVDVTGGVQPRYALIAAGVACSIDFATPSLVPDLETTGNSIKVVIGFQSDPHLDVDDVIAPWINSAPQAPEAGFAAPDSLRCYQVIRSRKQGIELIRRWQVDCNERQ